MSAALPMARECRCDLCWGCPAFTVLIKYYLYVLNLSYFLFLIKSQALPVHFQANMGAKNHAVILPNANLEATVAALTGAAFGAAGQR